jgi:hypothetical protein
MLSIGTWLQLASPRPPTPIIAYLSFVLGAQLIKLGMNNAPTPIDEADFKNVLLVVFFILKF